VKVTALADSLDPREIEERHTDAAEGRRVIREARKDGMACLWALLPADQAATVWGWDQRPLLRVWIRSAPSVDPVAQRAVMHPQVAGHLGGRVAGLDDHLPASALNCKLNFRRCSGMNRSSQL